MEEREREGGGHCGGGREGGNGGREGERGGEREGYVGCKYYHLSSCPRSSRHRIDELLQSLAGTVRDSQLQVEALTHYHQVHKGFIQNLVGWKTECLKAKCC